MNKAVLETLRMSVVKDYSKIINLPANRRQNSGRNRIAYPDGWEELYGQWARKEISSAEFLKKTGLKKATFYNIMTEYKRELKELQDFKKIYQ